MKLIVFFALIGSICALQHNMEYHYRYEGQIATGIPAIRTQVAALGIRARLILQMKERTQAIAKLTDIQVGEHHDDLECVHLRQKVPFTYQSMPDPHKKLLEQPFAVYFKEDSGHVMDVHPSDVEFITNIRKSIVEMLRLEPIVANLGGIKRDHLSKHLSDSSAPQAFAVEEESILGRCQSEYSITKLSEHEIQEEKKLIEKHLIKDVQSKSSPRSRSLETPIIGEQFYRLVRAINFDKCRHTVIQQNAGGANMSDAGKSLFRAVQSRSSVSTYTLKGEPGSLRVERAIVEGDVIVNPFGFKTERLQSITNQTLVLEKAQPIQQMLILPSNARPVKSWKFEVASPYDAPEGHKREWINYQNKRDRYYPVSLLTSVGIHQSSQELSKIEDSIHQLLDLAAEELYEEPSIPSSNDPSPRNTKTGVATRRLYIISKFLRHLPLKNVQDVFSKVFQQNDVKGRRKQTLLIDVAAASGASAPMKVLLQKMKKHEISHQRIASIFLTIPNNLFSPTIIPELMEYVKSLDIEKNPLSTSSALINFASLAERVCINHKKIRYSIPHAIFGREDCDPAQILRDFLPFLVEKAKTASKSYVRAIYIQAIINLGTSEIIHELKPFIYGKIDANPQVRAVAIYGLSRLRLPDSAKERVFDTLMTLVDHTHERSDIRQAALSTLITWHPSASWWQRMARSTWREPSRSMAAFITFTAESLSKSTEPRLKHQSRIASFVIPLLKPFSPSLHSSYSAIYSRYDPESKIGKKFDFAMIESPDDRVPSEIFTSLRENFGDLFIQLFEISVSSQHVSKTMSRIHNWMRSASTERRHGAVNARVPSDRKRHEFLSNLQELMPESDKVKASIYLRTFQNLYQYIPINSDVISKVAGKDGEKTLHKLLSGLKIDSSKYLDPINLEYFLPTEIGLPLRGSASMPTVNMGVGDVRLSAPGLQKPTISDVIKSKHLSLIFKTNYKYASKLISKLSVLSPWNLKAIDVGIDNYDELNLPFDATLSLIRSNEVKNVSLNLAPNTKQKFPVILQNNVPFTMVRKIFPDKDSKTDLKVIGVEKDRKPARQVRRERIFNLSTALSLELDYSGDAPYPFSSAFFMDYLRKPVLQGKLMTSPVAKQWQYSFSLDPSKSETKDFTLALSYIKTPMIDGSRKEPSETPDLSINDSRDQRLQKIRALSAGAPVYGVSAQLFFNAPAPRLFEISSMCTREAAPSTTSKKQRVVVAALSSKIQGRNDSPRALCSDGHYTSPKIEDLDSLRKSIQSHPQIDYSSKISYGSSCKSSDIAHFKGTLKVSEERKQLVSDELKKVCNHDPKDPAVELQTAAVYDIGTLDIEFSKDKIPRSIVNASYSLQEFVEGALFPHGRYNNMHSGQPNKISIKARRPVSTRKYSFHVETPHKYSIFDNIKVPYMATRIVPLRGLKTTYDKVTDSLLISTDPASTCIIQKGTIRTFDNVNIRYSPEHSVEACRTVAIKDNKNNKFYVRIRQNTDEQLEAEYQYLDSDENETIITSYKEALINNVPMSPNVSSEAIADGSGNFIMTIYREQDGFKVIWNNVLESYVTSNQIQITPNANLKNAVRGVCGDYDGLTKYDRTGPKNCLYTDDDLFVLSWMNAEGQGCNVDDLGNLETKVHDYQNGCPIRPNSTSSRDISSIFELDDTECVEHIYLVKPEGLDWCAAYDPVIKCKNDPLIRCIPESFRKMQVNMGCWPQGQVPPDVAEGEERGYIYQPPKEKAPKGTRLSFLEPTKCVKK